MIVARTPTPDEVVAATAACCGVALGSVRTRGDRKAAPPIVRARIHAAHVMRERLDTPWPKIGSLLAGLHRASLKPQRGRRGRQRDVIDLGLSETIWRVACGEEDPPEIPTPSRITDAAALYFDVAKTRLLAGDRSRAATRGRRVLASILRDDCGLSLSDIASRLGLNSHTSALRALREFGGPQDTSDAEEIRRIAREGASIVRLGPSLLELTRFDAELAHELEATRSPAPGGAPGGHRVAMVERVRDAAGRVTCRAWTADDATPDEEFESLREVARAAVAEYRRACRRRGVAPPVLVEGGE